MRALWLIDGSYIYKAMKSFYSQNIQYANKSVDYKKLKDKLVSIYKIDTVDGYYFNATPDAATDSQNAFHRWLKTADPHGPGIRVKLYDLKTKNYDCRNCSQKVSIRLQKGVDVGIATTALRLYTRYDAVILSAGDGDFEDFVRFLVEDKDLKLYIAGFSGSISPDLQQYASSVYLLNDDYADICDTRHVQLFENSDEIILVD